MMPRDRPEPIMNKNLIREPTTFSEEFAVGGKQLVALIERLVAKGNVRRLLIIKPGVGVLLETSLTTGVALVGVLTILAPVLTTLAAIGALVTEVRVKVVYTGSPTLR